ncbi:Rv2175c family DNA-binding protein [Nocardioides limicola]|uniref:Rv2175c family DNA-binding protein n=1 Tax=Nocardioides limicola TaxID=2803368 RepID=UPI00193BC314|nr:Rv2175c family DNA-binding protein [Nocardioides sp. DJM-14]
METPKLADLVDEWLDYAETAEALGRSVSQVRTLLREHQLAAASPTGDRALRVPALFIADGEIVKGLPGLLTLLADHGFDDAEAIAWIFTDDDLPGRPIDALRENRGTEARRRAQLLA